MHKALHFWVAAMMTLVLGIACSRPPTIRIDGSSTVYPVSEAAAFGYQQEQPGTRITVGVSGTGGGFKKLIAGEIDICDASRPIEDREQQALRERGMGCIALQVAFDGITIVVHPENDWVSCMTVEQLKRLWDTGSEIKKWSDLDPAWPDEEIKLYGPGTDSGTFDYFTKTICGIEKSSRSDYTSSEDDNVLVRGVTEDLYALGYFGYAYYEENKEKLRVLGVDGGGGCVQPSPQTINDGSYFPLSRPLLIYVRNDSFARPELRAFVEYYLGQADRFAASVGYVAVSEEAAKENARKIRAALAALPAT